MHYCEVSGLQELRKFCLSIGGTIVAKMKSTTAAFSTLPQHSFLKELAPVEENDEGQPDKPSAHLFAGEIKCSRCQLVTFNEDQLTQRLVESFGGNVLADGSWVDFSRGACMDCQVRIATQQQVEENCAMQVTDCTTVDFGIAQI
jgi:hypothetical protein